jgi:hypothetical protein
MIAMTKKILIGLAPLLAVAAFAVMPAMASATTAYGTCEVGQPETSPPCPEGEKNFTAFTTTVKVLDQKALGNGNFILKDEKTGAVIECEGLISNGTDKNTAGVGESAETLSFHHCFTIVEGKRCKMSTVGDGAGSIVGTVTDKVITETTVTVTVTGGFALVFSGPPPTGCPKTGTVIGTVTGSATGTQAKGSNVLEFSKTKGFKLGTDGTEFTGSVETYTEAGRPVVIN